MPGMTCRRAAVLAAASFGVTMTNAALVAQGALVEIEVVAVRPHRAEPHPGKTHKGGK